MIKCLKLAIKTIQKTGLKKTSGKKNYLGKIVFDEGLRLLYIQQKQKPNNQLMKLLLKILFESILN